MNKNNEIYTIKIIKLTFAKSGLNSSFAEPSSLLIFINPVQKTQTPLKTFLVDKILK